MAYSITYNGVPFLLCPAEIQAFVDHWLPLANLQEILPPPWFPGNNVCTLVPNRWPEYSFLRVGEYFYPTNASRWSIYHGIATKQNKDRMLATTQGGQPGVFNLQADPASPQELQAIGHQVQSQLFMLPSRPIGQHDAGGMEGLWLVTLVDERYLWQYRGAGNLEPKTGPRPDDDPATDPDLGTWDGVLNFLSSALGIRMTFQPVDEVYLGPEPDSHLYSQYENAAVLLDAVAANVGLVVVRTSYNTYQLMSASDCEDIIAQNRGQPLIRTAGGLLLDYPAAQNILPKSIKVCFPEYVNKTQPPNPDDEDDPDNEHLGMIPPHFINSRFTNSPRSSVWTEDSFGSMYVKEVRIQEADPPVNQYQGFPGSKTIRTTAKAFYDTKDDEDPSNQDDLDALAAQIAQDHWDWQLVTSVDEVYPATRAWQPEGAHDVIWTVRQGQSCTRAMRRPWNFHWTEFQHCAGETLGVGGRSIPLTVQEKNKVLADVTTTLASSIQSTEDEFDVDDDDMFPFPDRFKIKVDDEIMLVILQVEENTWKVIRGIDGTAPDMHDGGSDVTLLQPNTVSGVNVITCDSLKGMRVRPGNYVKGITEAILY